MEGDIARGVSTKVRSAVPLRENRFQTPRGMLE